MERVRLNPGPDTKITCRQSHSSLYPTLPARSHPPSSAPVAPRAKLSQHRCRYTDSRGEPEVVVSDGSTFGGGLEKAYRHDHPARRDTQNAAGSALNKKPSACGPLPTKRPQRLRLTPSVVRLDRKVLHINIIGRQCGAFGMVLYLLRAIFVFEIKCFNIIHKERMAGCCELL